MHGMVVDVVHAVVHLCMSMCACMSKMCVDVHDVRVGVPVCVYACVDVHEVSMMCASG